MALDSLKEQFIQHFQEVRTHFESRKVRPGLVEIDVTLRDGSARMKSTVSLDTRRNRLGWKAWLLPDIKKKKVTAWVFKKKRRVVAFHNLSDGLDFGRLLIDGRHGPALEFAMPLPKSISSTGINQILAQMQQAFSLRQELLSGMRAGKLQFVAHRPSAEPPADIKRGPAVQQPTNNRLVAIDQAIESGDLPKAHRLCNEFLTQVPQRI